MGGLLLSHDAVNLFRTDTVQPLSFWPDFWKPSRIRLLEGVLLASLLQKQFQSIRYQFLQGSVRFQSKALGFLE